MNSDTLEQASKIATKIADLERYLDHILSENSDLQKMLRVWPKCGKEVEGHIDIFEQAMCDSIAKEIESLNKQFQSL